MAKGKKHHEEEGAGEAWLLPYSDLMTLLLAVFIVLFAVSKVDEQKAKAISAAFSGIFTGKSITDDGGAFDGSNSIIDGGVGIVEDGAIVTPPPVTNTEQELNDMFGSEDLNGLKKLQDELQTYFTEMSLQATISTKIDERGLVISLNDSILFDSGSADIRTDYVHVLVDIGNGIKSLDNYIRVEGHTDNVPLNSNAIYPTNWELSCARSAKVVRLFIEEVPIAPDRLVTVGYGEFKPIADNNTPEGRAQNRRVDIIVLNMKYNSLED